MNARNIASRIDAQERRQVERRQVERWPKVGGGKLAPALVNAFHAAARCACKYHGSCVASIVCPHHTQGQRGPPLAAVNRQMRPRSKPPCLMLHGCIKARTQRLATVGDFTYSIFTARFRPVRRSPITVWSEGRRIRSGRGGPFLRRGDLDPTGGAAFSCFIFSRCMVRSRPAGANDYRKLMAVVWAGFPATG
jgi:hypothetical protein